MKKKIITFSLLGLLTIGSIASITVSAAESWDYGFNQKTMQWYNDYYHSDFTHYGSITKNGVPYYGPRAGAKAWSRLRVDYNGQYSATYNTHVLL